MKFGYLSVLQAMCILQLRLRSQRLWMQEQFFHEAMHHFHALVVRLRHSFTTAGRTYSWDSWLQFAGPRMALYVNALRAKGVPVAFSSFAFV